MQTVSSYRYLEKDSTRAEHAQEPAGESYDEIGYVDEQK